jgi:hypothetical protein
VSDGTKLLVFLPISHTATPDQNVAVTYWASSELMPREVKNTPRVSALKTASYSSGVTSGKGTADQMAALATTMSRWLKRRELEERDSDPSVLDMIKAIQPLMGPLQEKLDAILYPNAAEDAATVRELIGRFPGTQGLHALQNGPGFTRRNPWPPIDPRAPRVILFALNYEADA